MLIEDRMLKTHIQKSWGFDGCSFNYIILLRPPLPQRLDGAWPDPRHIFDEKLRTVPHEKSSKRLLFLDYSAREMSGETSADLIGRRKAAQPNDASQKNVLHMSFIPKKEKAYIQT